jgi:hypothetical protein
VFRFFKVRGGEEMNQLRGLVAAVLVAVWCLPAASNAAPARGEQRLPAAVTETSAGGTQASTQSAPASSEAQKLAEREKQTPDLQNFRGGGVTIYIGSGVLLITVLILLVLLL